ncbi:MAG TPA: DapH/DapD/GlmU-related protein [Chryseolinea sp.]|jgi:UDP-N-acetylglucosamine diphosphorylase / glucose-1-phosphate thymidylyltransferase / UDP-N-acetylgalactosamine diphosphorylase / glucosamine-1-phosphate N-acetyltransferase / galactosamine-1-phosphate N-acetyltransferase|nr:DapH/DapD/GlmU-related protein [Chryseolinea sp.]
MIKISAYLKNFASVFPEMEKELPWDIVTSIQSTVQHKIKTLASDYKIVNDIAIHKTARIEENVTMKGPMIISPDCFVGAHAYLRGGVYLGEKAVVGPGCEVKSSLILSGSALAHFNFVGDSLIGSYVNMEAGSIIANHYNERLDKTIYILINKKKIQIGATKFGALVGDHTKIGANGVLSPGTILNPQSTVKRLELVEQC